MAVTPEQVDEFARAASVPRVGMHVDADLGSAEAIRAANPEVDAAGILPAVLLGLADQVAAIVARDRAAATRPSGPYGWDPLTYLCFSRYLRLDRSRSDGFVRAARTLLDAGADPNGGWFEAGHEPEPARETVLYGAAGLAHHAGLTRLLLERGADPNDDETPYHTPESSDNEAMFALVESGKLSVDNLAMMLLRKSDWHDQAGIAWLLEHGADPNHRTRWGNTAFHNAAMSDNRLSIFELYLDHGADPNLLATPPATAYRSIQHLTVAGIAAWRGRKDVLDLLERRGIAIELNGIDRLLAACARHDRAARDALVAAEPGLVDQVRANQGQILVQFAGVNNAGGVASLLELGADVNARYSRGDGYFDVAPGSTALHSAAWRAAHETVALLLARGAVVDAPDSQGRTPLQLAVRATVDSFWTERRSPESVAALLAAGASTAGITVPTGSDAIDRLLS